MEIKNLKKAAERIIRGVKAGEKFIVFSDSDLDGVASAIIMKETIDYLNGEIASVFFPDREKDGYGISKGALLKLKVYAPAILIAMDLGIGNVEEVKIAKKMGFETIIIDHHEIIKKIPTPAIVVDPKQESDNYPFKNFAACGLVFKVSEEIFRGKMDKDLKKSFLELAAIATIADMMPIKEDNKEIVSEGLSSIEKTKRPGLKSLFELEASNSLNLMQKVSRINSLLNIRDRENLLPLAYRILISKEKKEADFLSKNLVISNIKKKKEVEKMRKEIEKKIKLKEEPIIFEGSTLWDSILLGNVAGGLSQKYQKPVFLYKKNKDVLLGGIRAPSKFNVVEPMKNCSKILITYGGHPQAAGFRIKEKNIKKFKNYLMKYFSKEYFFEKNKKIQKVEK